MEEQVIIPAEKLPEETLSVHQPPVAEKTVESAATTEVPKPELSPPVEKVSTPAPVETLKTNTEESPVAEKLGVPRLSDKATFALETGTVVAASILGGIFLGPIGAMALGALVSGGCNYIKQCYDKGALIR